MDKEDKFTLYIIAMIIGFAICLTIAISMFYYHNNKLHLAKGYQQTAVAGFSHPIWQKGECK